MATLRTHYNSAAYQNVYVHCVDKYFASLNFLKLLAVNKTTFTPVY